MRSAQEDRLESGRAERPMVSMAVAAPKVKYLRVAAAVLGLDQHACMPATGAG